MCLTEILYQHPSLDDLVSIIRASPRLIELKLDFLGTLPTNLKITRHEEIFDLQKLETLQLTELEIPVILEIFPRLHIPNCKSVRLLLTLEDDDLSITSAPVHPILQPIISRLSPLKITLQEGHFLLQSDGDALHIEIHRGCSIQSLAWVMASIGSTPSNSRLEIDLQTGYSFQRKASFISSISNLPLLRSLSVQEIGWVEPLLQAFGEPIQDTNHLCPGLTRIVFQEAQDSDVLLEILKMVKRRYGPGTSHAEPLEWLGVQSTHPDPYSFLVTIDMKATMRAIDSIVGPGVLNTPWWDGRN